MQFSGRVKNEKFSFKIGYMQIYLLISEFRIYASLTLRFAYKRVFVYMQHGYMQAILPVPSTCIYPSSTVDFSVFSAPLFGIFDVSQRTCSQNQCLFPLHLLVPLALRSNVYAATAIISMFTSSRLDLCTAILSNTASLRPRFGAEHCREYCTSKIQAP